MCTSSDPVLAAATTDSVDSVGGNTAWTELRREVLSDTGGVAYLTSCVERADFAALLEYTKTYETKLRKGYLTPAKKQLPKEQQETATLIINAATFDLIGINRSARRGQESLETATKYVQMLSEDLARFLALEPVPPQWAWCAMADVRPKNGAIGFCLSRWTAFSFLHWRYQRKYNTFKKSKLLCVDEKETTIDYASRNNPRFCGRYLQRCS
jgi:hypothetical protein